MTYRTRDIGKVIAPQGHRHTSDHWPVVSLRLYPRIIDLYSDIYIRVELNDWEWEFNLIPNDIYIDYIFENDSYIMYQL